MQAYDKLFSEIHLFCWNFEWLQNAVQAGIFDNFVDGNLDSPNARAGSRSKGGASNPGGGGASSTDGKRKNKGKKQW